MCSDDQHLWYSATFTFPPVKNLGRDWCVGCGTERQLNKVSMTTSKVCKDCLADLANGTVSKLPKRQANNPGPRCTTHWRAERLRRKAEAHEKRVQETYGLQRGEYAQLYEFQGGLCALCRRATGASRRLSVDHSHATGDVRGLLCRPCNTLLGHARDKIEFFERCIAYLEQPPYARLKMGAPFEEYSDE